MHSSARSNRRGRGARTALGLAFVVLVAVGGVSIAGSAQTACTKPVDVPGIGRSCPVSGGWRVLLSDGSTVLTHGHDGARVNAATVTPVQPSCASDPQTQFHNVLVYAHSSDSPNLYVSRLAKLREMAAVANGMLHKAGVDQGRAVDIRMLCANGLLVVNDAPILTPKRDTNFDTLITGLRALGFTSPMAKYWVWYEGKPPGASEGIATLEYDDRATPENRNNFGPGYAITWGVEDIQDGAMVMLHQAAHTLGAVQRNTPHATGAGHCTDGLDLMCEDDGGPNPGQTTVCSTLRFDCGADDYFDPTPSSSSWLATHWNLGSPMNRFVSGCLYGAGLLAVGAGGQQIDGVSHRAHGVSSYCAGRAYVLTAMVPQPVGVAPIASSQLGGTPIPDANVCWYRGTERIRCDTAIGPDAGVIPSGATSARVVLNAGASATYVLSAI